MASKTQRLKGTSPFGAQSIMDNMTGHDLPKDALIPVDDGYKLFDITITPTGIEFPENMDANEWEEFGRYLLQLDTSLTWALIDWLMYGEERKWGETYQRVASDFGLKVDSLYIYVSEARKIFIRNKDLSFAHHRAVARLPRDKQEYWLDCAVQNQWTVAQLKSNISPTLSEGTDETLISTRKMFQDVTKLVGRGGRLGKVRPKDAEKAFGEIRQLRQWLDDAEQTLRNLLE